jgi:Zn-dependent peptidase ImmA (M78 family)/transcriptional regulator with XRE-family HTH domain
MTQKALADTLDLTQPAVAQIESGITQPAPERVETLALVTGFPPTFFERPPMADFPMGSLLYRARAAARARDKAVTHRLAQLSYEIVMALREHVPLPELRVPRLSDTPENAARLVRSSLGLGPDTPIEALTTALERNGVVILALPVAMEGHDAFSLWVDDTPVIAVLMEGIAGDRLRWSLSHELAHLVLHRAAVGELSEIEKQADRFAAEFLTPRRAMRTELFAPVSLMALGKLKVRWKVAISSLARRAKEIEIVTERQYKYLCQQLSMRGWRTEEPVPIPVERPRALRQMVEMTYGSPPDIDRLAADRALPKPLLRGLLDLYAPPASPSGKLVRLARR